MKGYGGLARLFYLVCATCSCKSTADNTQMHRKAHPPFAVLEKLQVWMIVHMYRDRALFIDYLSIRSVHVSYLFVHLMIYHDVITLGVAYYTTIL